MEKLNEYLKALISTCSSELHLEPNKLPYLVSANGPTDVSSSPILGTQISMLIFPLIPPTAKQELPNRPEIEFVHNHQLGNFNFHIRKSPAGFNVTIRPLASSAVESVADAPYISDAPAPKPYVPLTTPPEYSYQNQSNLTAVDTAVVESETPERFEYEVNETPATKTDLTPTAPKLDNEDLLKSLKSVSVPTITPEYSEAVVVVSTSNLRGKARMDKLFRAMSELGASDLHLSVSMPPMMRKDGRMKMLEESGEAVTPEVMKELLTSIMPARNKAEFEERHDTDFAYEIEDLARFRANIFMDRKGMGGVFRIIPAKITTAEQLGLSKAILDLCNLSKGLVVVTGPTGSGKSTTLCAMVNHINYQREDHIITIEDPIEFTHENQKCLVNQREVHNHTDSFKDALARRAS